MTHADERTQDQTFAFDYVFGQNSTQPEVFEKLGSPLLDKAFQGYNATIFAYGQTGSGKTHTMMSDRKSDDRGLIPRISENLFDRVTKFTSESRKFLITCSFLEIYNEIVYDLLVPRGKSTPKTGLEIREQKGIGVYVKDLQEIVVDSSEKLQKLIDQGFEHRATASTNMNATSSRSHCLFIIKMNQRDENNIANNIFSKMNLVDLAGSERASRTGAQGDTLKEGANINKSLSSLGNVINALSKMAGGNKKVFIPYRDSKLTRVLQESLGGNALTTMMAAMSPAKTNYEETLSTLNYAKRAKTIKVNATKNEESEQIARLESEVEALKAKLAAQASGVGDVSKYEAQIDEMEKFMKQTWDDKEKASKQHEEERKALAAEAEKIKQKAEEEKGKRIQLLEAKNDLELSIQDLRIQAADCGSAWTPWSEKWPKAVAHIVGLEQRINSQCRAVGVLKDSVLQDLGAWIESRSSQSKDADEGSASSRLLLQQAGRKTESVARELEKLDKQERELDQAVAHLMPEIRRVMRGIEIESQSKDDKDEACDQNKVEAVQKVLSLIDRQLESHKAAGWGKIATEHRTLASFGADGVRGLLGFCTSKGRSVEDLEQALELDGSSPKASSSPRATLGLPGEEAVAALSRPLGLATGDIPDSAFTASSNAEAAYNARLSDGVPLCAFGGWCPAKDDKAEYLEIDLQAPAWICGIAVQGRDPANGHWLRTRALVGKILDPCPPERVFRRPRVRLIHDVVVAAHTQHSAMIGQDGLADFTPEQLEYENLQKTEKAAFFDLVVAKINAAVKALGMAEDAVAPIGITASEILAGKNTTESNRMLQLLCFVCLRGKDGQGALGGLLDCGAQWLTKYTVSWSADRQNWTPVSGVSAKGKPLVFFGPKDANTARYTAFGVNMPGSAVRYVRVHPKEWQRHPGLRVELYGWPEGVSVASLGAAAKPATAGKRKGADAGPSLGSLLADRSSRLDVIRSRTECMKQLVDTASGICVESWKEAQRADAEKNQKAMAEKTQVEQQLADALKQLEELRQAHEELQEKSAETEQKLVDTETEKMKLEVEGAHHEETLQALQERLEAANQSGIDEKAMIRELQRKVEDSKIEREELLAQVSVLEEECEAHKQQCEELSDEVAKKDEDLMITNESYCRMTEEINELRDDHDDEIRSRDSVIDTLTQRNKELADESAASFQQVKDFRIKLTDAEKALKRLQQGLPVSYEFKIINAEKLSPESTPSRMCGTASSRPETGKTERKPSKNDGYEEDFEEG